MSVAPKPCLWVLEIGEPLPLTGDERLLRYGLILPELAATFDITWWTSTFVHQTMSAFSKSDESISYRDVRIEALAGPGYQRSTSIRRLWHHWHFAHKFAKKSLSHTRPDVILVSNPTSDNLRAARRAAKRFDARLVVDIRDNWPSDLANAALNGNARWLTHAICAPYFAWTRRAIAAADAVVASSPLQLDYADHLIGDQALPPSSRTIYHPFPTVELSERDHCAIAKLRALGVDFERRLVVFAGTVGQHFELQLLVDAMAQMRGRGMQMVIAGDGTHRKAIEASIRSRGLDDDCVLTGWLERPELASLLDHAAVGLAPYVKIAGIGNKIAEYFAHGLPVVSSLRSDLVDRCIDQDCARYYRPGSRDDLVAAIESCLEFQADTEGAVIAERCREIHREQFSIDAASRLFETVLLPT